MTYSQFDPAPQKSCALELRSENRPKAPIQSEADLGNPVILDREQRVRDRALFDLAIDKKLGGCDRVTLKIGDLVSDQRLDRVHLSINTRLVSQFNLRSQLMREPA